MHGAIAGIIEETDEGYRFTYDTGYVDDSATSPISLTMPKRHEPYTRKSMFPFFDGLIAEGWLLQIAVENWKIDRRDRMGLLLAVCEDTIGAVEVHKIVEEEEHDEVPGVL